ncbi:hypothetical protein D027_0933B, partial [Vibrio parahaemolyticus 861]
RELTMDFSNATSA